MGFPGGSVIKNLPANAGDASPIPGSGRPSGGGNGNPLQFSCLGNPTDRGPLRATVHRIIKESDTTEQLNNNNLLEQKQNARWRGWGLSTPVCVCVCERQRQRQRQRETEKFVNLRRLLVYLWTTRVMPHFTKWST